MAERLGRTFEVPPATTTLGALHGHVLGLLKSDGHKKHGHVPSNIHWGLLPALQIRAKKAERKRLYGERALQNLDTWWTEAQKVVGILPEI